MIGDFHLRPSQLVISIFLSLLGITMIIHFDSSSKIAGIATIFIGVILVGIGAAAIYMYFKGKHARRLNK